MDKILAKNNIASVNFSATTGGNCNANNAIFRRLKEKHIAFVAAAGNDGASGAIRYPACNSNVISVGALNSNLTLSSRTSLQGRIDFFARGIGADFPRPATSFSAPIVSSAFALMQSAKSTRTSLNDMKFALRSTAPSCIQHRGDCVPVVTRTSAREAALCIRNGTCVNTDPPSIGGLGYEDNGQYGSAFGDGSANYEFDIDFSSLSTVSAKLSPDSLVANNSTRVSVPNERDVVLTFTSKMATSGLPNSINVVVNGRTVGQTGFHSGEKNNSFLLNRNMFKNGNNTITLRPQSLETLRPWGLTKIKAELNPVVPLTVGQTDSSQYGYSETPKRLTGLRTTFDINSLTTDYVLFVTGWDIDRADETQVFLNEKPYGFLTQGIGSSVYSAQDSFILRKADLNEGTNIIEFVQRSPDSSWSGFQNEKWAVRNLRVQRALPDLSVNFVDIVDKRLKPSKPFQATANISNVGMGSSVATSTVRFYASLDNRIGSSDTLLKTVPFAPLLENRSRVASSNMQTSLVNQGYYFGVCIDRVPTESVTSNNCSKGIRLESDPVIAPILLLLDDD